MYDLPPSMTPVVAAVGLSAATSIVHIYGGARVYIPSVRSLNEDHHLARLIGLPLARKLAAAMGGESFLVPTCTRMLERTRAAAIIAALEDAPIETVAKRFCLTSRAVLMIAARHRAAAKA